MARMLGPKTARQTDTRGTLARDILHMVADALAGRAPARTADLIAAFSPESRDERNRIWKTIKYLEEKDRIEIREQNGDLYVTLTRTGENKLDEDAIWDLAVKTPGRWDHKWRLVLFDLPVGESRNRHSFRAKLEDLGFRLYQRSVFIYPYECGSEIDAIARWYGVDEHIRYIVATEIHDMHRFAREFGLS
jgi:DNA-binding transcriptional regulator PaaX